MIYYKINISVYFFSFLSVFHPLIISSSLKALNVTQICISPNHFPKVYTWFPNSILHIFTWVSDRHVKSNIPNWATNLATTTPSPTNKSVLSVVFAVSIDVILLLVVQAKTKQQFLKSTYKLILTSLFSTKPTHLFHWLLFHIISRICFSLFPCYHPVQTSIVFCLDYPRHICPLFGVPAFSPVPGSLFLSE